MEESTGLPAHEWVELPWFQLALNSPHNQRGTAARFKRDHAQSEQKLSPPRMPAKEYLLAYLKMVRNALAHSDFNEVAQSMWPSPFVSSDRADMQLLQSMPIIDRAPDLTVKLSGLFSG